MSSAFPANHASLPTNLTMNWQDGRTALMSAARNGQSNVVETLLQHGASLQMQNVVSVL